MSLSLCVCVSISFFRFYTVLGDVASVLALADAGANLNAPDSNGITPMFAGAEHGHVSVIQCLLRWGGMLDMNQVTALSLLCKKAHGVKSMRVHARTHARTTEGEEEGGWRVVGVLSRVF